jgi:hypothetical protein
VADRKRKRENEKITHRMRERQTERELIKKP